MNRVRLVGTEILKHRGFFSIDQIQDRTGISRRLCRDVLVLFCQEGIIRQIKKWPMGHVFGKPPMYGMVYRFVNRKKLAARIVPRRCEGTVQDRMWSVIFNKFKNYGSFNLHDLTVLAGAEKNYVRWYLKALRRDGYILPSRNSGPGIEWRLIKDLGPRRPYVNYRREKSNIMTPF
jgi:DNA-binding IscR family transcriptional regulator